MIKGVTKSGFKYQIDEKILDDYEVLEALSEVDENPLKLPKAVKMILGNRQTENLKKYIKKNYGKVPLSVMEKELTDILSGNKTIKNS